MKPIAPHDQCLRSHSAQASCTLPRLQQASGHCIDLEGRVNPPLSLQPRSSIAALETGLFRQWCAWLGIASPSAARRDGNE